MGQYYWVLVMSSWKIALHISEENPKMDYNKNTQGNTQGEKMRQTLRMKRKQRRMRKVNSSRRWANKDDDSDEVEALKEDAYEDEDQKFDTDNVALEDNEEYFEV